ncbi:hypothetical protein LPTSP4_24120 [Leptospira ryugenii]|uniref:Lipoprotein n=1 Tax=Leptospira ryugenii TaxID=1917863 RepID=A0A2P2E1V8_9LEPT|nr:hypothetical protein [Leptospira ryugenii]GBF50885.1 hypothetical protein LPTSP4_24120 [Leptospira ryugenii]
MKHFKLFTVSALLLFIFGNCASSTVGLATSNRPIPNTTYETIKTVDKVFTWYSIDIILIGASTDTPPIDKIYSDLVGTEEADAIVNIRYYNEKAVFGPFLRHRFGIKGDLVRFTNANANTTTTKGKTR